MFPYIILFGKVITSYTILAMIGIFAVSYFGIESKIGWIYQNALVPSANGVRRFPVQLIEAICNFILFLYQLQRKQKCKDTILPIYLTLYAGIRFLLEFLRGDSYRGFLWGFSTSQIISIAILIWSIGYGTIKKLFHN